MGGDLDKLYLDPRRYGRSDGGVIAGSRLWRNEEQGSRIEATANFISRPAQYVFDRTNAPVHEQIATTYEDGSRGP
jgi:hypothetical protein